MIPLEFVAKWGRTRLRERQSSQEHFLDLCRLLKVATPAEADPLGLFFTFDQGLKKEAGGDGFADVWRKDHFAWEYKGRHKDLVVAYSQLQLYRDALGNPPLLVVCDFENFEIHTNFNNTVKRIYKFTNDDIAVESPVSGSRFSAIDILRALFEDPEKLNPGKTPEKLTEEAARLLGELAENMRQYRKLTDITDHEIARFIMRMIFCFFASDVGLLSKESLTNIIRLNKGKPAFFRKYLGELFTAMRDGGEFLMHRVPHFNGGLFDDSIVPEVLADQIDVLERLDRLDWSDIEPSVFGTLFERILDPDTRAELGAHYTSKEDIQTVVEPVLMSPLRAQWAEIKSKAEPLLSWRESANISQQKELYTSLSKFQKRLSSIRVLDPACGSGNFLYTSLSMLKALEKEVLAFAAMHGIQGLAPKVHPRQLFGIEINEYAHQLSSAVVWIGYIQWKYRNAIDLENENPILQSLENIHHMDAILDRTDPANPREPEWPDADVIVGNPPFLGSGLLRSRLGNEYVDALFSLYGDRIPNSSDLCCYWLEKARAMIEYRHLNRAGLLATQGIRGITSRRVLERIKQTGDIFFAYADRPWILDGANVHISIIGFDEGSEHNKTLDGNPVTSINADLTAGVDLTKARRLKENLNICYMGPSAKAPFDINTPLARTFLKAPININGRPNSDVVRPVASAVDLVQRTRNKWTIDFGLMSEKEAAYYELPFEYVKKTVYPIRSKNRRSSYAAKWWQYAESRPGMRAALHGKERYLATPGVSKHRIFVWVPHAVLCNQGTLVFARDDDYTFGILQSKVHELWARAMGTQLRDVISGFRYTPTTTFETFPFPSPTPEQTEAISITAKRLNEFRERWLNPSDGEYSSSELRNRTLTNLYNSRPTWLDLAHYELDQAVFQAYGWAVDLTPNDILSRLLTLNLERDQV
ncbi:Methyltransferase domain [Dehalogenimonas alkenigignens]|uniref:site-specific DNA-methyltransferase (adenine-specific) n=1 Tax=Dehalogenimonas alkenigignens TaxID=1217799 RepID=A0A0W0GGY5_9CHLR|nr:DNA methyltransferase [Dehalogenimonas alkenigignens]KTB47809.1 Methyltransferase domain [Dehalogenimonas alkenigignens]